MENILTDYEDFISNTKTEIKFLQRKFEVCRSILEYDYSNSEIYEEEYKKAKSLRIDEYYEDIDKRYELSREDVLFLREYAEINKNGIVSSEVVKEKYLKKYELIKISFKSVYVHNYFNQLDTYTKKQTFLELVSKHFDGIVKKIESLASVITNEEKRRDKLREVEDVLEKKKKIIDCLHIEDYDFSSLVDMFFGTDVYYYKWFRNKDVEQDYNNGFVCDQHVISSISLNDNIVSYDKLLKEKQELIDRKSILSSKLLSFFAGVNNLDFSDFIKKSFLENILSFLKDEKNNKDDLFRIFSDFSLVEGVLLFFRELSGQDTIINVNRCFDKYFKKTYGDGEKCVDEEIFIRNFIDNVISFYERKIKEVDDLLEKKQIELSLKGEKVRQLSETVKKEAELQREVFTYRDNNKKYVLTSLTPDEEKRLFIDIKEYLVTEFSLNISIDENTDVIALKKV